VISAKSVPALVHAHQEALGSLAYRAYAKGMQRLDLETALEFDERASRLDERERTYLRELTEAAGDEWTRREADSLNIAALFHVTEPMAGVAMAFAAKLDEERDVWTEEHLPARTGFLVFERPVYYLDARGVQSGIAAVSWRIWDKETSLPFTLTGARHGERRWNIELAYYADAEDKGDAYGQVIAKEEGYGMLGRLHYVIGAACPIGSSIGPYRFAATYDVERLDKAMLSDGRDGPLPPMLKAGDVDVEDPLVAYELVQLNFHRLMFAIFALMQTSAAELEEFTDKRIARRTRNRSHRPPPMVTIITLRHAEQYGARDHETGRWLTYRSWTRAHPRRVHTRDGVKWVWINRYVRGPEGAPWHQPVRVTTLAR
jgi:hypothetical protein